MIFDAAVHKGADMACGYCTGAPQDTVFEKTTAQTISYVKSNPPLNFNWEPFR